MCSHDYAYLWSKTQYVYCVPEPFSNIRPSTFLSTWNISTTSTLIKHLLIGKQASVIILCETQAIYIMITMLLRTHKTVELITFTSAVNFGLHLHPSMISKTANWRASVIWSQIYYAMISFLYIFCIYVSIYACVHVIRSWALAKFLRMAV